MKKFQLFRIKSSNQQKLKDLIAEMKKVNSKVFTFNEEISNDYAKNIFTTNNMVACFVTDEEPLLKATVWTAIYNDVLTVTNITSKKNESLGVVNYNYILMAFVREIVEPALKSNSESNLQPELTGEDNSLSNMLSEETFKLLLKWEQTCNKSMPLSHPEDMDLWQDFVISYFFSEQHGTITPSDLSQWLSEDRHWPSAYNEEIAEVSRIFEYSIDLLKKSRR